MFKWPWSKQKEELAAEPPLTLVEEEKDFDKSRIAGITFTVDRLPYLKTLLAQYEEDEASRVVQRQRFSKVSKIFEPIIHEFTSHFGNEIRDMLQKKELLHYPNQELVSRIFMAYSGTLLNELESIREKGWDGENCYQVDEWQKPYQSDVRWRLRALVEALEAGNSEVTLDIPSKLSSQYETWFTNSISWAINTGNGPAAPRNK